MRGFRASRAAINFKAAHFGNAKQFQPRIIEGGLGNQQKEQHQPIQLPDWLKMPEQPKREAKPARQKKTALKASTISARKTKAPTRRRKAA